jgi:RNA-directed DNA polymerase
MGWDHFRSETTQLMDAVVERENMTEALHRVERNKGAAGIDKMSVSELRPYLKEHWSRIKGELLSGSYQPSAVREVMIPKPGSRGVRKLGIPTVVDRLIQQAMHQVLSPVFDPFFSTHSYGFRPGRSAHQAVLQARECVSGGRRWVVDMDLEKFFDNVNHDLMMSRLGRRVGDRRVLAVIRRYLQAGTMAGGVVSPRQEGTPQGGPLSPLLSNILLDDLDKELERRGHAFCRYADDCNIYVQSRRAGTLVAHQLPEGRAEVEGEPGQERGVSTLATQVPRLLDDDAQTGATEGRPCQRAAPEKQAEGRVPSRSWP